MKLKIVILSIVIMSFMMQSVFAASEISLNINDNRILNDDEVIFENGILYGRVADFSDRMGIETKWLGTAKLFVLEMEDQVVSFGVNTNTVRIGQGTAETENASMLIDNRLYVPLETLSEYMGIDMTFDRSTLSLYISDERLTVLEEENYVPTYTDDDVLWLARIIDVETGDASINKRIAVANVVLNRVKDERFPSTIYDVIFASGQFPPAHKSGFTTLEPKEASVIAAKRALEGENNISTCLYFNYIPFSSKSNDFYMLLEGDYFYY